NLLLMMIRGRGETLRFPARRTRHHYGNFAIKVESLFHHAGLLPEGMPCFCGSLAFAEADLHLAAAVVASVRALHKAAAAKGGDGFGQVLFRSSGVPGSEREAAFAKPLPLTDTVLNDVQQLCRRTHRRIFRGCLETGDGDLLD